MERLTFDGNFCDIAQCREFSCPYSTACMQRQVWEKLKAYEDTGLTPEEVSDAVVGAKVVSAFGVAAERLRELAEADKDGRVFVLPCKPGDILWTFCQRYTEGWNDCLLRVKSMVSKAPAADVAPVVRCKDCAHRTEMGNCGHPRYHGILPPAHPYDFCSYGARMNGDSNDLEAMKDGD